MTRQSIHRIRSVRQGLTEKLFDSEPVVPHAARDARSIVERYILVGPSKELQQEIEALLAKTPVTCWTLQNDLVRCPVQSAPELPPIPDTHRWKGGAARLLLRRALDQPEFPYPLRDLDLARIGRGWTEADAELSKKFMPGDFAHGHGVEVIEDRARYFRTRDLSINEILAGGSELECTLVCLLDTIGQVLRPCRYFSGTLHQPHELSSRGSAKMLRFRAEFLAAGASWGLAGVPPDQEVDAQHLAFEVNKAFSRGEQIGWGMISTAVALGLLPKPPFDGIVDPLGFALKALVEETYGGAGFFTALSPKIAAQLDQ